MAGDFKFKQLFCKQGLTIYDCKCERSVGGRQSKYK